MKIHAEPAPCRGNTLLEIRIPSELRWMVPLAVRLVRKAFEANLIQEEDQEKIETCCLEALKNAIIHGNHQDPSLWITVRLFQDGDEWGISFQDEGQGFSEEKIPDPEDPAFPWKEEGRGIHLMRSLMDHVDYFSNGRTLVFSTTVSGKP